MTDKPTPSSDPFSAPDSLLSHSAMPPSTALPPPQSLSPGRPPAFESSPLHRDDPPPAPVQAEPQQPPHFWQPPQAPAGQQPPHFWQQPQAPGWTNAYPYAPPRASNWSGKVVVALGILVAIAGGVGAIVVASQAEDTGRPSRTAAYGTGIDGPAITIDTPLKPDLGASIYSDDFRDSTSGWTTAPTNSGTTYTYTSDGYVAAALGDLHHFIYAPYHSARQQLSMTVTATQSPGAPSGAGFGVSCRRGSGSAMLIYEFIVFSDGWWAVERRDGAPDVSTGPQILEQGAGDAMPGTTPLTVQGVCASVDSKTTRLVLYIDGSLAADTTDTDFGMPSDAWLGGIDISSRASAGQTVTVTRFEERDLSQ